MSRTVFEDVRVWKRIVAQLEELSRVSVDTGVTGSATVEDDSGLTIVELATIHEFGTEDIPQRSFIRQAWDNNINKIEDLADKVYDSVNNLRGYKQPVNRLGMMMRSDVLEQFKVSGDPSWQANSVFTIEAKGSNKPLIDTGLLRASITYQINFQ